MRTIKALIVAGIVLSFTYRLWAYTVPGFLSTRQFISVSSTTINASTPTVVGMVEYCNGCANTTVCVSTGTAKGAWSRIQSPTGACN